MFDIVAGTSIGAINAAILVSYVIEKKKANPKLTPKECWEGSVEWLVNFWNYISSPTPGIADLFSRWWWWDEVHYKVNSGVASSEAARRYYSTKQFFSSGIDKVFSAPEIIYDERFYDNFPYTPPSNIWYRYNNKPLKESITTKGGFANFPIKTRPYHSIEGRKLEKAEEDEKEKPVEGPRLLVVSVDVAAGTAVTFDSYGKAIKYKDEKLIKKEKPNNNYEWKTEYGKRDDQSGGKYEHVIRYDEGITLEHVMASGTMPVLFNYQEIDGRKFWDGGILSNTPLRELIGKHKSFWEDEIDPNDLSKGMWKIDGVDTSSISNNNNNSNTTNEGQKVPDLEVYIVNVWPSKEKEVPSDYDGVKDRRNDIGFHDKTEYDEKVALLVSDYIELIKQMKHIAVKHFTDKNKKKEFEDELENFLKNKNEYVKSTRRTGEKRTYEELIKGRFKLTKVVRIERIDDADSISSKFADFTSHTIKELIKQGENDARKVLE